VPCVLCQRTPHRPSLPCRGFEPPRIKNAIDFVSIMSTIPSPGHMHYLPLSFLLGMEGLEPSRFKKSTDFKSVASTDSATSPLIFRSFCKLCNLRLCKQCTIIAIITALRHGISNRDLLLTASAKVFIFSALSGIISQFSGFS